MGVDGVRYVVLREVPFDRDADVSYDGFIRRYNADLANDFGNLLNRTLNMVVALPRWRAAGVRRTPSSLTRGRGHGPTYAKAMDAFLLHDALGALWEFVGEANRFVDREQPWTLAKQAKAGDAEAADRLRGSPGRPAGGLPGDLPRGCAIHPERRGRVQQQLGLELSLRQSRATAVLCWQMRWHGVARRSQRENWHSGNPVSTCRKRDCLIVVYTKEVLNGTRTDDPPRDPGRRRGARARKFYEGLFGWETSEMPEYPELLPVQLRPDRPRRRRHRHPQPVDRAAAAPVHHVDSLDETLPKVTALGGKIVEPKTDIPGQGWYAVIDDTEGNQIGLYETAPNSAM